MFIAKQRARFKQQSEPNLRRRIRNGGLHKRTDGADEGDVARMLPWELQSIRRIAGLYQGWA